MQRDEFKAVMLEALSECAPNKDHSKMTLDTPIAELQLDSIATMEMIGFIEEAAEVTLSDEDLKHVTIVSDLLDLVNRS